MAELRSERHLPYGITQCYLPPDTRERASVLLHLASLITGCCRQDVHRRD